MLLEPGCKSSPLFLFLFILSIFLLILRKSAAVFSLVQFSPNWSYATSPSLFSFCLAGREHAGRVSTLAHVTPQPEHQPSSSSFSTTPRSNPLWDPRILPSFPKSRRQSPLFLPFDSASFPTETAWTVIWRAHLHQRQGLPLRRASTVTTALVFLSSLSAASLLAKHQRRLPTRWSAFPTGQPC
jgi:hypothetical protein